MHAQETDIDIPTAWNTAFAAYTSTDSKFVKSTNKKPIVIHPNQVVTINGIVRDTSQYENAVTENLDDSCDFNVCLRIVAVKNNSKTARVPVRVCNISARPITIKPNTQLCSLQEVNVIKTMDPSCDSVLVEGSSKSFQDLGIHLPKENLSPGELNKASDLLGKWKHIFSTGRTDLGFTDLIEHEINLVDETPFIEPYRRIPPALFEEVRQHLKEMLDAGAIRESQSPFSSNVVLVRKKDGSLRFCIDYRKLNNRTVKDAYYLPRIEETIDTLSGSKYFSKLDLRSGYWQVGVKESDKMKTAFSVGPLGFFECNRMAFGLCNAQASFQRLMERCMGELHLRECLIYLDDIIIFSKTFDEHLVRLANVFRQLEVHGLKLKGSKCEFFQRQVNYLGHIVSDAGIHTDPDKIAVLKEWKPPTNVKELRSFLGFAGYYRRFVCNYSSIVKPLNALLVGHPTNKKYKKKKKEQTPWTWGPEQQQAFDTIIDKLTSPPVLAYTDYSKPFLLNIDASGDGLGVLTTAKPDATGHRWLAALSSYNFSLVYRAGRINNDADALSHLHSTNKETLFNDVIKAICHAALVSVEEAPAVECILLAQNASIDDDEAGTDTGSDLSQIDWPAEQTVDTTLYPVRQLLSSGHKPTKRQIALEPKPCQ